MKSLSSKFSVDASVTEGEEAIAFLDPTAATHPSSNVLSKRHDDEKYDAAALEVSEDGDVQPERGYRDKWFAVAFLLHVVALLLVDYVVVSPKLHPLEREWNDAMEKGDQVSVLIKEYEMKGTCFIYTMCAMPFVSMALAAVFILLMKTHSERAIKVSVALSPMVCIIWGLLDISNNTSNGLWWFIIAYVLYAMTKKVLPLIPFAAMNLKVALSVIIAQYGEVLSTVFVVSVVGVVYLLYWMHLMFGVSLPTEQLPLQCYYNVTLAQTDSPICKAEQKDDGAGFFLIFSLCWTILVLRGVIRVTVAGVCGTWWFQPPMISANSRCGHNSSFGSFFRATTYSFGSISLGSLAVGIMDTVRSCLSEGSAGCIGSFLCIGLRDLILYANSWAYVYAGVYGDSLFESGKKVHRIFVDNDMTVIRTDVLVWRVILVLGMVIGGATSVITAALANMIYPSAAAPAVLSWTGFMLGILFTSLILTAVDGASMASIVCFLEASDDLKANHPEVYQEMYKAFSTRFPTAFASVLPSTTDDEEAGATKYTATATPVAAMGTEPG